MRSGSSVPWRCYLSTGKTITQHNRETLALPPRYDALTITLAFQRREDMWARIDRRVDEMMERGLAQEVRSLLDSGVPEKCTAMQAIGYKEMAAALRGTGMWTGPRGRSSCAPVSTPSGSSPGSAGTGRPNGSPGTLSQILPRPSRFRQDIWKILVYSGSTQGWKTNLISPLRKKECYISCRKPTTFKNLPDPGPPGPPARHHVFDEWLSDAGLCHRI